MQEDNADVVAHLRVYRPVPGFPRAAAFSGVLFAVLYMTSLVLLRLAVPADPRDPGDWLQDAQHRSHVRLALNLVPFSGIAFLWFMAVLRVRLGLMENRLVTTVFLGSGLLFLAMLFTAVANAQALLQVFDVDPKHLLASDAYRVNRATIFRLMNPFGIRMEAVLIFVTSSVGLRTGLLTRWVSIAGFPLAVVLLVIITDFAWFALLFPLWVLLVSICMYQSDVPVSIPHDSVRRTQKHFGFF